MRRAVPQTHFTSVKPIPCFKSLEYTCPWVQVARGALGTRPPRVRARNYFLGALSAVIMTASV